MSEPAKAKRPRCPYCVSETGFVYMKVLEKKSGSYCRWGRGGHEIEVSSFESLVLWPLF
jgi:hypothetical protein